MRATPRSSSRVSLRKAAPRTVFLCTDCGNDQAKWFGRCPSCSAWNTAVEQSVSPDSPAAAAAPRRAAWHAPGARDRTPRPLADVETTSANRLSTGYAEVDRVLGGGLVAGALVLLCGDPGIGKSTLALQVARSLAGGERRVLYLSGEESPEQVRLRAERLGTVPRSLLVLCETELEPALEAAAAAAPQVLVVDSIQTLASAAAPGGPGSVSQVRECALALLAYAKGAGVPTILVGHVTKDGGAAGPRVLEHMVDAVVYLEGERFHQVRLLRAGKNRFGSTSEIGVFEMTDTGLVEMRDPRQVFLGGAHVSGPGSFHVVAMQGARPLAVEVQALVTHSGFAVPQRAGSGVPPKRLAVLIAVLEKRLGVRLSHADVFVNVAGGLYLEEPAADLGLALAIAGSRFDRAPLGRGVALGEVGLGGELRPVPALLPRLREAAALGFEFAVVPAAQASDAARADIAVRPAETLAEALDPALTPRPPRAGGESRTATDSGARTARAR
jgi:DNA repair protein RadA/Sms